MLLGGGLKYRFLADELAIEFGEEERTLDAVGVKCEESSSVVLLGVCCNDATFLVNRDSASFKEDSFERRWCRRFCTFRRSSDPGSPKSAGLMSQIVLNLTESEPSSRSTSSNARSDSGGILSFMRFCGECSKTFQTIDQSRIEITAISAAIFLFSTTEEWPALSFLEPLRSPGSNVGIYEYDSNSSAQPVVATEKTKYYPCAGPVYPEPDEPSK